MGSMKFVRSEGPGRAGEMITFDASPQYTLEQKYGYNPATLELTVTSRDANFIKYDVRGAHGDGKLHFVGQLTQKTRERIRQELARR